MSINNCKKKKGVRAFERVQAVCLGGGGGAGEKDGFSGEDRIYQPHPLILSFII